MRRYKQPLKQILGATRDYWDLAEIRPAVRKNFGKMTNCRTPALGAEVYPQKPSRKSFITRANRGHVRVVGIEPRCCGNGSSGLPSPISHTWASVLRCRMFCGPSFDRTGTYFRIWPHSGQQRYKNG